MTLLIGGGVVCVDTGVAVLLPSGRVVRGSRGGGCAHLLRDRLAVHVSRRGLDLYRVAGDRLEKLLSSTSSVDVAIAAAAALGRGMGWALRLARRLEGLKTRFSR